MMCSRRSRLPTLALGSVVAIAFALALPLGARASAAGVRLATAVGAPVPPAQGSAPALVLALADRLEGAPTMPGLALAASTLKRKLPPALLALERRMRSLRVNTERGRVVAFISGPSPGPLMKVASSQPTTGHGHKRAKDRSPATKVPTGADQRVPFLTADYETSVSPKLADVREVLFGGLSFQERVIGEQTYVGSPLFAAFDGGRKWVSVSAAELAEAEAKAKSKQTQSSLAPQVGGTEVAEAGFGKLADMVAAAQSVREIGAVTVDGQPTIEFEGGIAAKRLFGKLSTGSAREKRALRHSKWRFAIYIAADGLPVRTKLQIQMGKAGIDVDSDILATEIPVSVTPPPASETITEAELKKREESPGGSAGTESHPLSKREQAEEKRINACLKRRLPKRLGTVGKRRLRKAVKECERVAQQGSK